MLRASWDCSRVIYLALLPSSLMQVKKKLKPSCVCGSPSFVGPGTTSLSTNRITGSVLGEYANQHTIFSGSLCSEWHTFVWQDYINESLTALLLGPTHPSVSPYGPPLPHGPSNLHSLVPHPGKASFTCQNIVYVYITITA